MTFYLFAVHLFNLVAPAAMIAVLLLALSWLFPDFFKKKQAFSQAWWIPLAINFLVGAGVLVAGLVLLDRDGKMLTYVALVLAMAASQWLQVSGWKR